MSLTGGSGNTECAFSKHLLILAFVLPAVGCGAARTTSTQTPSPSSTPQVTIKLNLSSVSLAAGAQQQFTATVQGTTNTAVTWSVDSVTGGNAAAGTVNSAGMYTAPAHAGTHTVTATSVAETTQSASATVTVTATVSGLSISPASAGVTPGTTQQFSATMQGQSNPSLTWAVDGINGGNSTVGTVSTSGLYTAPSQMGSHTISASVASPAASASAAVSVFDFSISPEGTLLAPGGTQQFAASIQGLTNTSVTWSVDGNAGGNSSVGTISSSGLYTAPGTMGPHTISAASVAYPSNSVTSQVTVENSAPAAVLTYHNDDTRDGAYLQETTLTPSNVNSGQFGKLVSYPVDGQIYAQPLYLPQVSIPNKGSYDVIYVVTQNNSVYAFDADATAANPTTLWKVNLGASVPKYDTEGVSPNVGILSTPVIDVSTNTMYLVAEVNNTSPPFWLHALDVTTGADKMTPVALTGSYAGDTLEPTCYQRMGLALSPVTNLIYIAFGSCTHGWILAYDKSSLVQKAVFEDTNGAEGGGFWASDGAPAIDDATGDLYVMSGTDAGDQDWINSTSMVGYNDSFLRLDPNNLSVLDYFSPDDNYFLAQNDADLGSGADILVPGSSSYPHELVGGGKDGKVFVINRDSMGGYNNSSNNVLQTLQTGTTQLNNIFSTPVYWNGTIYLHDNADVLRAYAWNASASAGSQLSTTATSVGKNVFNMHGATPSLSANGTSNGIVWEIDNSTYNGTNPSASGVAVLHAYDATNVANELYNSTQAGMRDQAGLALKFTVPTIANGRVFISTANELDIYGLLGQ